MSQRIGMAALCASLSIGLHSGLSAQSFSYSLDLPETADAFPGFPARFEAVVRLTTEGITSGPGAQGWSISLVLDGGEAAVVTTAGTVVSEILGPPGSGDSFVNLETTDDGSGVLAAVVLSLSEEKHLPPSGTEDILRIFVEADAPEGGTSEVEFRFEDGLQGSGEPVDNKVAFLGDAVRPATAGGSTEVVSVPDCCRAYLLWGFSAERVGGPTGNPEEPYAPGSVHEGLLGLGELCMAKDGEIVTEVVPGREGEASAYLGLVSLMPQPGLAVEAWSVSVALDGDATLTEEGTTSSGTSADEAPEGRRSQGFERTEIVDPADNGGQAGVVSAVILSYDDTTVSLARTGTESVLKLGVRTTVPQPTGEDVVAVLRVSDPLVGSGQPVANVITVSGMPFAACNTGDARVALRFTPLEGTPFVRGNSNAADDEIDLSDAIFTLNWLFMGGEDPPCVQAADADGDGLVVVSDPIYTLNWLFDGGPDPLAPFPECSVGSPEGPLSCEAFPPCE